MVRFQLNSDQYVSEEVPHATVPLPSEENRQEEMRKERMKKPG
jgi:hypothetical protein